MLPGSADLPAEGLIEGILHGGEPTTGSFEESASRLLTFLFADIRGYTTFTQRRGDLAAAELVAKFDRIVRDLVRRFDGTVVELRGDEVLCVFTSPRQCLRLAVALQQRFVEETEADASLPLAVGIGIDAGEAVPVPHGYRGDALNLAARLCARAKAGEVLASPEVTHLARTIDDIRYLLGARLSLKGFKDAVRPIRVLPDGLDPAVRMAELLAAATSEGVATRRMRRLPGPFGRHPRWTAAGATVLVALLIGALLAAVSHDSSAPHLVSFSENSLGILDPHARTLESEVAVDPGPIAAATGLGAVWTANSVSDSVSRVEIDSHRVHTVQVGSSPSAIAVGLGSVWVTNSVDGTVSRIDPATNKASSIAVGSSPGGIVVAHGWVWVTNTGDGTVDRIDPSTNTVAQSIGVGTSPSGIGAGRDIWVANSSTNTVTRIDGFSHHVVGTIPVGHDPKSIAVLGDSVWITCNLDGTVARIAVSGSTVDTVQVGPLPGQVVGIGGHVWVTSQSAGTVAEIDPAASRVVHSVAVGPIAAALVAVNGKLWVATTIDPGRHRGGTLRLIGHDVDTMDPSYAWDNLREMYDQVYDGLVAFRQAGGADGTTIVPDLATEIPEPLDGGRTYVFHLRAGIRWSDGRLLTVADVERGLQRTIAAGFSTLGSEIAGSSSCGTRRCNTPGITVDAAARTVTIALVRPDGNFIDDLTASVAVPAATPLVQQKSALLPTTGPYRIDRYVPHRVIVFTRNRYYRPWAPAAHPPGYPDIIEWRIDHHDDRKYEVNEVGAQRADWTDARGAGSLDTLAARFSGERLWVSPTQTVHGVALNTRIPPFSDIRVRRALAYALNRRAVVDAWITPGAITCQIIPPDLPAHRPYCPYTLQPDAKGDWTEPDFPTAQGLVAASRYHGTAITVWSEPRPARGMAQVVAVLRQLGYHARLRVFTGADQAYFPFVSDSRNRVQAAFFGWVTTDASPASVLETFRCHAFVPADPQNNQNPAEFCDPSIDLLMSKALSIERSDPATANALWAQVDRRIVDAAPWVPLVTPSWIDVLSSRTHNYVRSVVLGVLFDQMWVR